LLPPGYPAPEKILAKEDFELGLELLKGKPKLD